MSPSAQPDPFDSYGDPRYGDPRYGELRAAEPTRHEIGPDSWLSESGVPALRSRIDAPADGAWDPLTDPWPTLYGAVEPTPLEHEARADVDPLGLSYADPQREEQAALITQPFVLGDHPSGPLPRAGVWPPQGAVPSSPAELESVAPTLGAPEGTPGARRYDVTLMGPLGEPEFGFGQGRWYALAGQGAREVPVAAPLCAHPDKAGQIVQLACWWLRENANQARALDLATELAMAVSELARRTLRV